MNGQTFILLLFPGLGVFFMGLAALWWIAIQDRELKRKAKKDS